MTLANASVAYDAIKQVAQNILVDVGNEWGGVLVLILGLGFALAIVYSLASHALGRGEISIFDDYDKAKYWWDNPKPKKIDRIEQEKRRQAGRLHRRRNKVRDHLYDSGDRTFYDDDVLDAVSKIKNTSFDDSFDGSYADRMLDRGRMAREERGGW